MNERILALPRARSSPLRGALQEGQRVVISRGVLAGMTGVLVRCIGGNRWIVRSDGAPTGLYLEVGAAALRKRGA